MPVQAMILCPFLSITHKSIYHLHSIENTKSTGSQYLFSHLLLLASMRHKKMSNIFHLHICYLVCTASLISLLYICILLTSCSINIIHSISKTLIQGYYKELEVAFKGFSSTSKSLYIYIANTFYISRCIMKTSRKVQEQEAP